MANGAPAKTTRKRTTAAQRKAAEAAAVEASNENKTIEEQDIKDVLMIGVVRHDNGATSVVMQVQGDVRPTEVPEIIRMAGAVIERNRKLES